MAFRIVSDPARNVVYLGETQSFSLHASDGPGELAQVTRVDWSCVNDPEHGTSVFQGPTGGRDVRWTDARWTHLGDHWVVAAIRVGSRTERASLPVHVVEAAKFPGAKATAASALARNMRVVADPPLQTVSPEQRMTFRLELTSGDAGFRERIRVKWYCLN